MRKTGPVEREEAAVPDERCASSSSEFLLGVQAVAMSNSDDTRDETRGGRGKRELKLNRHNRRLFTCSPKRFVFLFF